MVIHQHKDDMEQQQLIKEYSEFLQPKSVLDVGAGYGRLSQYFEGWIGIDRRRRHIEKASGDRVICRGGILPFPDKKFDLVFSCTVLMLNVNGIPIIEEMARVSKRCVLFMEMNKDGRWFFRHPYEEIMKSQNFNLFDFRSLRTSDGRRPLALWLFRRKGSRRLVSG